MLLEWDTRVQSLPARRRNPFSSLDFQIEDFFSRKDLISRWWTYLYLVAALFLLASEEILPFLWGRMWRFTSKITLESTCCVSGCQKRSDDVGFAIFCVYELRVHLVYSFYHMHESPYVCSLNLMNERMFCYQYLLARNGYVIICLYPLSYLQLGVISWVFPFNFIESGVACLLVYTSCLWGRAEILSHVIPSSWQLLISIMRGVYQQSFS